MKFLRFFLALVLAFQIGCAAYTKKIALGMAAGGTVGALVGNQIGKPEDRTRNTIISSLAGALIVGGFLFWHYREIEQRTEEISGRYARYRLCDPEEMRLDKALQFGGHQTEDGVVYHLPESLIGKLAITLDDNTKWVYPAFRKRYLMPELGENQVLSTRYIWEIIKPGSFVTRSQHPSYFAE